jgi:hypothetical protein
VYMGMGVYYGFPTWGIWGLQHVVPDFAFCVLCHVPKHLQEHLFRRAFCATARLAGAHATQRQNLS